VRNVGSTVLYVKSKGVMPALLYIASCKLLYTTQAMSRRWSANSLQSQLVTRWVTFCWSLRVSRSVIQNTKIARVYIYSK